MHSKYEGRQMWGKLGKITGKLIREPRKGVGSFIKLEIEGGGAGSFSRFQGKNRAFLSSHI